MDSVFYEPSIVTALEATLVAEPSIDDFAGVPVLSALAIPALQASLYAGDVLLLSLLTLGLVYLPMSTSSTTSPDNGDCIAQLLLRYMPSNLSYSDVCTNASGGKPLAEDFSPWATGNAVFARNKFTSLEP